MPIYKVNGEIYDIPANKQEAFEKKYPDASVSYISGNDAYDIPIGKRESFLTKFPDAQLETNYQSSEVPIFNDAPNSQLNAYKQPESKEETIRGFGAAAKQSAKSLGAGVRNAWGEFTNMFTGSSRDDVKALSEFDRMIAEGKDVAEETENTWSGIGGDLRTAALEILPNFLVKGWKERVHDKAEEQKILRNIHDALKETNGDVDKARSLLVERAKDMSYGDTQMAMAAETMSEMKPTEGFGAWLGENAVQMIPSASALIVGAVTKSPTAARIIGQLGMGGMTAATAGQSMYEARQSGANDYETRKVGIVDGMIEYLTEKIPFDRYTKRLTGKVRKETAEALSDALSSPNSPAKEEMQNVLTKANEVLGGKLFSKKSATDYLLDMAAEGASEFSAEALQTITSIIYEEPENYPTITEVLSNGWQGFLAGAFMGAVLGGSSAALANHQHKERRRQQGFVKIALVDNGENGQDVGEVVAYDPGADRFTITDGNNSYEVEREAIKQTFDYTVGEFESGIYRQLEDDAIASGNVSNGQVVASADRLGNARQKLEDAMSQAGYTDEQKNTVFADLDKGDVPDFHPQAKALWNAADAYTDALNRDREIQSAREVRADNERKAVLDAMQLQMGGEFWQKGSTTMQENGMEIVEPDMVEVGTMQNGKQVYILSTPNDNGEVPAITEDGKKMFIRHTDLQDGTQLMPLQEFLDAKVSKQKQQAEQLRMAQEAAPQLDAIRQKYQVGVQVNLGTEESPTLGQVIGIKPENDGVIIQTETGIAPYTFEQLADMEGTPIRVMTDAQQAAAEAAEIQAAEATRMTELAQTPEQISEAEKETDNAAQMENVATETPLPTNPDGSVNEDALFRESPERWAVWNDEQSQDGGVSSAQYIETKLAKAQARLAKLQNMYSVEDSLNKKRTIQAEIVKQQGVVDDLATVMQKYTPAETVQSTSAVAQQERTTESVLASLNDGTLTEEEIRDNIDANLAEAQKSYDKYAKKAPKMGTDKDAYLAEKQKYEQGLPALQQEIDFWNGVKQAYEGAMQQESLPTEESMRPELTEEDMNPQTPQELAARELGLKEGGIKLLWDSVRAHTGFGNGERQKFFGIFRSKEKGGMTIEAAGDRLMEIDREYTLGLLDQSDPMAGVNAILDVLGDVQTIGDLRNYIANNREAQVVREASAAYSAMNAEFEATHGMTMEEWAHANEVQRIEIMSKSALTEAEEYERNVKFAEEENQYGTNEQSTGTEGVSGGENQRDAGNVEGAADSLYRQGDSILQEAQSDNTGGETVSDGQTTEDVSEGDNQDGDTSVHAGEQTSEVSRIFAPSAEVIAKIVAERREAVHERVAEWEKRLGVKVNVLDAYWQVQNKDVREAITQGKKVWGWFEPSTGEVFIYTPDYIRLKPEDALNEVDKTIVHEAVAHKGLREFMGQEKFNEFCDKVWNEVMTEKDREKFINYPGVNGNTRAAADEYMASISEKTKYNTIWDKIARFFKELLGIETKVSDKDIRGLLKQSYANLAKNGAKTNPNSNQQAEGNVRFRTASGSLVGMHNISEEKLRKVIKQGGLANPSTAVVNIAEYILDGYGDISLIMPSSMVDADTGDNVGTYTGDAWTPTYPPISRQVDEKGWKAIKDVIRSVVPEDSSLYYDIINGLQNYLEDNRSSKMEFVFLKTKGIEPEIAYKGADGFVGMRNLEAILGVQGLRDGLEAYERYKSASPMAKRSFNMWLDAGGNKQAHRELKEQLKKEPKLAEVLKLNEDVSFAEFDSFTYDIFRKEQDAGKIDTYDTMGAAARYVDANNLRGEFEAWLESLMEQAGAKEVFFAGYTRSGERIYKDNTLENVSRHMRMQGRTNAYDDHGLSATKSALLQRLTSLSQIRKNKARLQNEATYNKEYDALKDRLWSVISQLADMQEISSNQFMNIDYAESRLQEAITKKNPVAYLNKEYGYEIDPSGEYADELNSFIKDVQQMPAKYFETKFERPVYLNEFAAAVMPTTTSEDVKQAVAETGLPIFEYDSSVKGSRREATLKATEGEGVRFRVEQTKNKVESLFNAAVNGSFKGKPVSLGTLTEEGKRYLESMSGLTFKDKVDFMLNASDLVHMYNEHFGANEKDPGSNIPLTIDDIRNIVDVILKPEKVLYLGEDEGKRFAFLAPADSGAYNLIEVYTTKRGNLSSKTFYKTKKGVSHRAMILEKESRHSTSEANGATLSGAKIPILFDIANQEESNTRFRASNENQAIFVSNAARAVEGIKQEKATPEQWLKMIEKNGGLKAGEDKWMGLSDWLKASDKKTLTKQEVLDFINGNMIVIEETHYSEDAESDAENTHAMVERILQEKFGRYIAEYYEQHHGEDDDLYGGDSYEYAMDKLREEMNDEFPYTIERSNSVVYLTFPYEETDDLQEWADKLGIKFTPQNPINYTRLDYTTDGLTDKHEIALTVPNIDPWNETDDIHFGDAGDGRAIAWIRFGETWEQRPSPQISRKVLVIDEIQSKRHQAGRENGYSMTEEKYQKRLDALETEGGERLRRRTKLLRALTEKYGEDFHVYLKLENTAYVPNDVMAPDEVQEWYATSLDDIDNAIHGLKREKRSGIPDAPFDKNWHELAMKRMLRYAAENGYDVIAWTKGDQQAERYNLANYFSTIERQDNPEIEGKRFVLDGYRASFHVNENGVVIESTINDAIDKPLADIVGKELAIRMMQMEDRAQLAGLDLAVGGEGMKGFYDKMLPAFMNKYGKKWGVKVEDIALPGLEDGNLTMHSVPVTEEMKSSVMEGQTMFRATESDDLSKRKAVNNIIDRATAFVNGTSIAKASELRRNRERKRKEEAAEIYSRVLNNQFDDVTLQLIDKYIQDATPKNPYGRRISQRLPQEMERGLHENQRAATVNALFSRISESAVPEADRASQQGKREIETKKKELLKNWAIASGMWYDNLSDVAEIADVNPIDEGTESKVYASTSDNTLVKVKRGKPFGKRFRPDIDDLVIFNHVFPNTAYTIVGYGDFGDGISTIVTQPVVNFAEDANVSVEERVEHMESLGFKPMNKDNTAFTNGKIVASDIQGKNIVKDINGDIRIIDADMKLHTKDMGGEHVIPPVEEDVRFSAEKKNSVLDNTTDTGETSKGSKQNDTATLQDTVSSDKDSNNSANDNTSDENIRYRTVTDQETLDRLNSEPTIKVYRAMQVIDGKLYPPMSAKVDGKLREPIELGQWEEAEERPDLADDKGRFKLDKGNKTSVPARYNPYFHTSRTPLNDQFSSAQTRPNLVTVEVEIPESELTSGYKAEKAKDSVGEKEWKAGVVQGKLSGTRKVILSRWDKPIRIVPDSEVADRIVEMFEGREITMPSNVVTPSLRAELEERGVPFVETDNQGRPKTDTRFRATGVPTESVVEDGLRLTPKQFTDLAANIFKAMPEDVRREVVDNASRDNYNLERAVFQKSASLAERSELSDSEIELAKAVAEKVEDAVLGTAVQMQRPLATNEALWMLYQAVIPVSEYDLIGNARMAVVADNLGFSPSIKASNDANEANIRFRATSGAYSNSAANMYNAEQRSAWGRLRESFQDMHRSVDNLMQAIEKTSGKAAETWENVVVALNRLSSKNLADKKKYMRDFLKPMWEKVLEITEKFNMSIEDIERYMMIKHGLERNKVLAARDARNFYREQADRKIAAMKADKSLSKAEQKARIQRVEDTYDNHVSDIEAGIDAKFQEFREKDYGGLTALYSDFADFGTRDDYETEEQFQAAALAARTPKYNTLAEAEQAAETEIADFESKVGSLTDELWQRVNAATKETLKHQYKHNMLSKEQYDRVKDMFEYYVPLRGFADNTAEDMYSYYNSGQQGSFAHPLQSAKGRKTEAESPLGWIGSMAESAIQMDNKNDAKLRLYYFAVNRPDNDLIRITETWYEWTGEYNAEGKKIFEPVYPTFNGPLDGAAMQRHMDAFDSMMEQQAMAGNAFRGKRGMDLNNSVINVEGRNKPEHIVSVKVGGKDYSIIINGNPRAAQAINGLLNIDDASDNPLYQGLRSALRLMSGLSTSLNPEFWISNLQRDMMFAFLGTSIRTDAGYTKEFAKNYAEAFKVISYLRKDKKGKLGTSETENYYREFSENGGITGYTVLTNNAEYDKMLRQFAKDQRKSDFVKGVKSGFEAITDFGEALEQVSRFAAYMTARKAGKDIETAIYEAKEVAVNFNRKGSGQAISWEESAKLRNRKGKPLNWAARVFFVGASSLSPVGRSIYMFFNASIQGLRTAVKLAHDHPKKSAVWAGVFFTMGMLNAILHAVLDDDDDYLDMPEHEKRNNLLLGGNGVYFKWALPQEVRPFYAMADMFVNHAMGRTPHKNITSELATIFAEMLPINTAGAEGLEGVVGALVPSYVSPIYELIVNKNFAGAPIYREMPFVPDEQQKYIPGYTRAYSSTNQLYVDVAEILNNLSGGDQTKAGWININPASIEHIVEGYGGGTMTTINKLFKTMGVAVGQDFSFRNTPFLSRLITVNDERYRNSYVTEMHTYYKGIADDVKRRENIYKKEKDVESYRKLRSDEDYRIYQIYRRHKKILDHYDMRLKLAKDEQERRSVMKLQDAERRKIIKEISNL